MALFFIIIQDAGVTVPVLTGYRVTLKNTTDDDSVIRKANSSNSSNSLDPELLSPDTIQYNFTNVSQGRLYTVTVIAVNGVGGSSPTIRTISKCIVIITPGIIHAMYTLMKVTLVWQMCCPIACFVYCCCQAVL